MFNHVAPMPGVLASNATLACYLRIENCVWLAICHHLHKARLLYCHCCWHQSFIFMEFSLFDIFVLLVCPVAVHHALPAASQPGVVDGSCPYERVCPVLHFAGV